METIYQNYTIHYRQKPLKTIYVTEVPELPTTLLVRFIIVIIVINTALNLYEMLLIGNTRGCKRNNKHLSHSQTKLL
jgi:hypothetical protein